MASFIATGRCICGCRKALTQREASIGDYRGLCALRLAVETGDRAVMRHIANAYGFTELTVRRMIRDVNEKRQAPITRAMVAGGAA